MFKEKCAYCELPKRTTVFNEDHEYVCYDCTVAMVDAYYTRKLGHKLNELIGKDLDEFEC